MRRTLASSRTRRGACGVFGRAQAEPTWLRWWWRPAKHPVAVASSSFEQLVFAGGVGQLDLLSNASARAAICSISGSGDALVELGRRDCGEDEVGVGVDEAGRTSGLRRR